MIGICFKEPLFHLTVQGIKKQTRRIINPQPTFFSKPDEGIFHDLGYYLDSLGIALKPRYKVGETVYLKEPYSWISLGSREPVTVYKYDNEEHEDECGCSFLTSDWKNKMFMPESEARHFIKITDVRVERLQDILEEDCILEGILEEFPEAYGMDSSLPSYWRCPEEMSMEWFKTPRQAYAFLIDKINGKGTWESNPWVWVIDYKLCE